MMLSRNFCYHYILQDLKASIVKAGNGEAISHRIRLPPDPYVDLYNDLENLGIVQHSRVTSVLKDIYQPEEDGVATKYGKKGVVQVSSTVTSLLTDVYEFEEDSFVVRNTKKGMKLTTITHYINPVIYNRLEPKTPKLCTRKCDLLATTAYLAARNVPASGEIRKAISNGLRKVAVVHEKNWWKWLLGAFLKVAPMISAVMTVVVCFCPTVLPYITIAMSGLAAVGTMLYCITLFTENQKARESSLII